ncbi:nuclear factor NF-kappa-B p110 subunit-like [Stomoxys calcitrans]|uniref:nuclear factor NF-kappa-B p110 subunit-like n=1 Tax=Stomoxys calcitrans TaxID=35570 RepID=UPI0027E28393|nr:nuclear factor NF-kappa-B p110 subunit-like [Stomoxys calcitrans]
MPINLALNANNVKCIKEFLQLMRQVKNPEIIEKCKGMFNVRNKDGNTILTLVWQQKRDVFKEFSIFCIRFDVNLNDEERNLLRRDNLHYTWTDYNRVLRQNSLQFLSFLNYPNHLHNIISCVNTHEQNLLHACCEYNRFKVIGPLVRLGCNPAKQDDEGQTPFDLALKSQSNECIEQLIIYCSNRWRIQWRRMYIRL